MESDLQSSDDLENRAEGRRAVSGEGFVQTLSGMSGVSGFPCKWPVRHVGTRPGKTIAR